jgi:thiol-disulfide isomerase/thioredoxin
MKKFEIYTARYCGTCRGLKRRLSDIKDQLASVEIIYRDIDVERAKARSLKLDVVPTLIYYNNDVEIKRLEGLILEADILELIKGYSN